MIGTTFKHMNVLRLEIVKWNKTKDILPDKGKTVIACDLTEDGACYYLTHLFRRQSAVRKENWWHQYYESKDTSKGPEYWMDFPPILDEIVEEPVSLSEKIDALEQQIDIILSTVNKP